jgi:hypothetical protein
MTVTLLSLAQACALPKSDAIAYIDARVAKGFTNEAKAANWTRALEDLRANRTPDARPQIAKIAAAAKAAPKAPKAAKPVLTPVVPVPNAPKAVAFTKTHEVVAAPKGAVAHLHNRLCNVEQAVMRLADLHTQQAALLARLTAPSDAAPF